MATIETVALFDAAISCTRKDGDLYRKIKTALESKKLSVYQKSELPEHTDNAIDNMLRMARVMVLVLSDHVLMDANAKKNALALCRRSGSLDEKGHGAIVVVFQVEDGIAEKPEFAIWLSGAQRFGVKEGPAEQKDVDKAIEEMADHIEWILHAKSTIESHTEIAERLIWAKRYKQARYFLEKNLLLCDRIYGMYEERVIGMKEYMTGYMRLISLFMDMGSYTEALEELGEVLSVGFDACWDENGVLPDQFSLCCVRLGMNEEEVVNWLCENVYPLRGQKMVPDSKIRQYNQSRMDLLLECFRERNQSEKAEEEYGIFISYKSEDEQFARTVFQFLQEHGKNVFFARESLPKLGKSDYEEAIFRALGQAKHMVLVASEAEYLNTAWVKDEWSTFNNEIREGRKEGNIVLLLDDKAAEDKGAIPIQLRQREIVLKSEIRSKLLSYLR